MANFLDAQLSVGWAVGANAMQDIFGDDAQQTYNDVMNVMQWLESISLGADSLGRPRNLGRTARRFYDAGADSRAALGAARAASAEAMGRWDSGSYRGRSGMRGGRGRARESNRAKWTRRAVRTWRVVRHVPGVPG